MTDLELITLYQARSETAIEATAKQYGAYCSAIAMNILCSKEDSDECVNDVYLQVWNAIPPARPRVFAAFIGRITRNVAINRYNSKTAAKRGGNTAMLLGELDECIPARENVEKTAEANSLSRALEAYLGTLKEEDSAIFVRRYWHGESVMQIAARYNASVGKVKMNLSRTRKRLKNYLESEGFYS